MATLNVFERALGAPKRIAARQLRPGRAIRRLGKGSGRALELAEALRIATGKPAAPEDEARMAKVEALRSELAGSQDQIDELGYGGGGRSGSTRPSAVAALSRASTEEPWCRLLYALVRALRPQSCLELGTSLGISAAYVASALDANGSGRLITIEGSPGVADRARQNLAGLGLQERAEVRTGRFQEVLDEVLGAAAPVDVAYIDGHHDEQATLDYFDRIAAASSQEAVMLFDDISWSRGMDRAWKAIDGDKRCAVSANLGDVGLCSLAPPGAAPAG